MNEIVNENRNDEQVGRWTEWNWQSSRKGSAAEKLKIHSDTFPLSHKHVSTVALTLRTTMSNEPIIKFLTCSSVIPELVVELIVQLLFALAWKLLYIRRRRRSIHLSWHLANDFLRTPQPIQFFFSFYFEHSSILNSDRNACKKLTQNRKTIFMHNRDENKTRHPCCCLFLLFVPWRAELRANSLFCDIFASPST